MSEDPGRSLERRIERLERLVEHLMSHVGTRPPTDAAPPSSPAPAPQAPAGPKAARRWDQFSEQWLGRVGVAFVILSLAFLFRLAFDRGWITPPLRVAFGLLVGSSLLVAGLRLEDARRRLSQVLMGGAIGVLYLVGYAGHARYGLLPYPVAFSYMITVTLVAFVLSVRQDRGTLAAVGAAGGLLTPFLLFAPRGTVGTLVVYTSLILIGAGAVQAWRGWRLLHLTLAIGGFAVLAAAGGRAAPADRAVLLLGAGIWWLVTAASPLLRRWALSVRGDPAPGGAGPSSRIQWAALDRTWVPVLGVLGSLAATALIAVALDLEEVGSGGLILGFGGLYAVAGAFGRPVRERAAEVAAILIPIGTLVALPGPVAFVLLSVQALVLHLLAARARLESLHALGHVLAGLLAAWFALDAHERNAHERMNADLFDGWSLSTLGSVAVFFATSFAFSDRSLRNRYRLGAYAALLYWLLVELTLLPNGPALVSIAWGVLGVTVLMLGWRRAQRELQGVGLATLAVTAGKLLLVDMAQLDVVWRILVFLGFGAAFLGLSYLVDRPHAGDDAG